MLPLVKPDVRISRIRLSCKLSSFPILIPSTLPVIFPVIALGKSFTEDDVAGFDVGLDDVAVDEFPVEHIEAEWV